MAFTAFGGVGPSLGAAFGSGLAQPIHRAVDILQQQKLKEIEANSAYRAQHAERQNWAKQALQAGVPEEVAGFASLFNEKDRIKAFPLAQGSNQLKQMEQQYNQTMQKAAQWDQQQRQSMQPGISGAQPEAVMQDEALKAAGIQPQSVADRNPYLAQLEEQANAINEHKANLYASPEDRRNAARMAQKESLSNREFGLKQKKFFLDQTKTFRDEVLKRANAAKDNLRRLDEMEKLGEKGDLISPLQNWILDKFDINIGILTTPDSEAFKKIEKEFLQNIKEVFGGRINELEVRQFLQGIPTLNNTPEGRKKIIKNMRILEKGRLDKARAMEKVINSGFTDPATFPFAVEKELGGYLDKNAAKFSKLADQGIYMAVQKDPLSHPSFFEEGTEWGPPGSKKPTKIIRNREWEDL